MRSPFVRIGDITINRADIMKVYHDIVKSDFGDEKKHFVRLVTREIDTRIDEDIAVAASANVSHDYEHGSREALAIVAWLEHQTEDLLAEPCNDSDCIEYVPV